MISQVIGLFMVSYHQQILMAVLRTLHNSDALDNRPKVDSSGFAHSSMYKSAKGSIGWLFFTTPPVWENHRSLVKPLFRVPVWSFVFIFDSFFIVVSLNTPLDYMWNNFLQMILCYPVIEKNTRFLTMFYCLSAIINHIKSGFKN